MVDSVDTDDEVVVEGGSGTLDEGVGRETPWL